MMMMMMMMVVVVVVVVVVFSCCFYDALRRAGRRVWDGHARRNVFFVCFWCRAVLVCWCGCRDVRVMQHVTGDKQDARDVTLANHFGRCLARDAPEGDDVADLGGTGRVSDRL